MVDDFEVQEREDLVSDFNEAKFQITRLGALWDKFDNAMLNGNFIDPFGATWISDRIYGNLSRDSERLGGTKEKYEHKIKKINQLIMRNKDNNVILYHILQKKEQILRRLQDEAGKGARYSYSDEDLM